MKDSITLKTTQEIKETKGLIVPKGVNFTGDVAIGTDKFKATMAWYANEVGVKEVGGNNKGKRVGYYLKTTANLPEGYAWCAAYVYTGAHDNGIVIPKSAMASVVASGNVVYKRNSTKSPHFPTIEGDSIIVFGLHNGKRIFHTGVFAEVKSSAVKTYEGNTNGGGSADGDVVGILIRPKGTIYNASKYL